MEDKIKEIIKTEQIENISLMIRNTILVILIIVLLLIFNIFLFNQLRNIYPFALITISSLLIEYIIFHILIKKKTLNKNIIELLLLALAMVPIYFYNGGVNSPFFIIYLIIIFEYTITVSNIKNILLINILIFIINILYIFIIKDYASSTILMFVVDTFIAILISYISNTVMNYNVNIKDKYEIERESREKIEKINNDKDEFISTTSHELRTPVAAIRGYLQLIQFYPEYKDVKPEIIERFSSLENIIEDLSTLIENLLNASRLDLNRIFVNKLNVNINQEVISAIGTVLKKAKKKNITILFNPKVVNIFLILDPEKFIDAISNIIDNSIKFSSENSIILISIENKNNKIKIKIKDKGIGMSKEKLSKLFDKFDNSEENTKKTVLGMYLAKRFIDIIGGNIIVQSKEKIGTTTIIEF